MNQGLPPNAKVINRHRLLPFIPTWSERLASKMYSKCDFLFDFGFYCDLVDLTGINDFVLLEYSNFKDNLDGVYLRVFHERNQIELSMNVGSDFFSLPIIYRSVKPNEIIQGDYDLDDRHFEHDMKKYLSILLECRDKFSENSIHEFYHKNSAMTLKWKSNENDS